MGWWDDGCGAVDQNGQPGSETKGVCNGAWIVVCLHCPLLCWCAKYMSVQTVYSQALPSCISTSSFC